MLTSLTITCVGDVAPVKAAQDHILRDIQRARAHFDDLFTGSDIVFANLEVPITSAASPREDKKYVFKGVPDILCAFSEKVILSIANNHIMDYGEDGLRDTLESLIQAGVRYAGAGRNLAEAGRPVITQAGGRAVGFLACADRRYQAATEATPGVFPALADVLIPSIRRLRESVDIVYVSIHLGMEYVPLPTPVMIRLADACRRAGAHVVVYHHAHCASGYTLFDDGAILWGTGNFLFPESANYPFKPWFDAAAWTIVHDSGADSLELVITPYGIDAHGMPRKLEGQRASKILHSIDGLSSKIKHRRALGWLRIWYILKPSYLRVAFANYRDIARRRGVSQMAGQIMSSVWTLFIRMR